MTDQGALTRSSIPWSVFFGHATRPRAV